MWNAKTNRWIKDVITSSVRNCSRRREEAKKKTKNVRWLNWFHYYVWFENLPSFDEPSRRPVMGGEGGGGLLPLRLPSACLTACLAYRSETQTPAGCRPEEGWIITQNSVSLCPALCLQGPPDRCDHDSFLIPPAEKKTPSSATNVRN